MTSPLVAGLAGLLVGVAAATASAPIAAGLFGGTTGAGTDVVVAMFRAMGMNRLEASMAQGLATDPVDKMVSFLVVQSILAALPGRMRSAFPQGAALGTLRSVAIPGLGSRPAEHGERREVVLAGASAAAVRDQHIRIEFFYETGSPARRRLLGLVSAAMTCVFFLVLCVLSGRVVWDEYSYQETSMALGVPRWWYTVWVPILSVAIAVRAAQVFVRVRRGEMLPGAQDSSAAGPVDEEHAL